MISAVNASREKLNLLVSKLENKNLSNLPNMLAQLKSSASTNYDGTKYIKGINVIEELVTVSKIFKNLIM